MRVQSMKKAPTKDEKTRSPLSLCPRSWAYLYCTKPLPRDTAAVALGVAIHAQMEREFPARAKKEKV